MRCSIVVVLTELKSIQKGLTLFFIVSKYIQSSDWS